MSMNKQESLEFAKKYLEDMLSFYGTNTDIEAELQDDDFLQLTVPLTEDSSILIGHNGDTLRAFQYVISTVLRNNDAEVVRVNVDIAGYKEHRAEKMIEKTKQWAERVIETGSPYRAHLNAADRRTVHQAVTEIEGVDTHSEGEGRDRCIVITKIDE